MSGPSTASENAGDVLRETLEVDIACVGFGPAVGGFLTTLAKRLEGKGALGFESEVAPGMPLQVVCYERADAVSFGVSGVATRALALKESFPGLNASEIPLAAEIGQERLVFLLDPKSGRRRSFTLGLLDRTLRLLGRGLGVEHDAVTLPYIPAFLRKQGGLALSIGQFNEWVASRLLSSGSVQIWPGTPVAGPLVEEGRVSGVRLLDQGLDSSGLPGPSFMPGMDVRSRLTVVGDGPVGAVGRCLDERFGLPEGRRKEDWAIGMKAAVELREGVDLSPGTLIHTFGFPEPEIFGFLYVLKERIASVGIFVPSFFKSPVKTAYRYLQHFMLHPYLWRHLEGATMRSWGAKTVGESGWRGEPFLAGDGYARIGEGSGSTNVLTGSGVDEAWATGVDLAHGVIELLEAKKPFTRENLEAAYVARRRRSFVEKGARTAARARDGFERGFLFGLLGMALAGLSQGRVFVLRPFLKRRPPTLKEYFKAIPGEELEAISRESAMSGVAAHEALLERSGWEAIPYDGKLLVSHQDALLLGGKVAAAAGYKDHVVFRDLEACRSCGAKPCVEICSGQALSPGRDGVPAFDREKCIHCGACQWSCALARTSGGGNIELRAGVGGLHSSGN